jgi:hypothetical protein
LILENLLVILQRLDLQLLLATHTGVISMIVPFVLALSFISNLKSLTPVFTAGTLLLIASFVAVGVIIQQNWGERPAIDELTQVHLPGVPLAVCAILLFGSSCRRRRRHAEWII